MGCSRSPRRRVLAASIVATTKASRSFHYHGHRESLAGFERPGRHLEPSVCCFVCVKPTAVFRPSTVPNSVSSSVRFSSFIVS